MINAFRSLFSPAPHLPILTVYAPAAPVIQRVLDARLTDIANRRSTIGEALPWIDSGYRLPRGTTLKILKRMGEQLSQGTKNAGRLEALRLKLGTTTVRSEGVLDRKECKALSAAMGQMAKSLRYPGSLGEESLPTRDICKGLQAIGKASAMQWKLEQEIKKREEKYKMFQHAGARRSKGVSIEVGGGLGLPLALSATLGGALGKSHVVATDDIHNVQDIWQTGITGRAKASVGTEVGLGIDILGSVEYARGPLCEWGTANERAAMKATARINQVQGMGRLIHALRPLSGALGIKTRPLLGRYDATLQRADQHRESFPGHVSRLGIGIEPTTWKALTRPRLRPLMATLTTKKAAGQLNVSLPFASAGAGVVTSEMRIDAAIKTSLSTYLDVASRTSRLDTERVEALEKRATRLWARHTEDSPMYGVASTSRPKFLLLPNGKTLAERLAIFESDIDSYERIARDNDLKPRDAKSVLREKLFARSWLAVHREDVLIHMLLVHASLKSQAISTGDMSSVPLLKETFERTADRLYSMRIRHDSERVYEASSVTDQLTQSIRSKTVSLNIGVGQDFGQVGVSGSLTHIERDDPNPLREGEYIDLELAFSATADPAALLASVLGSLEEKIDSRMFSDVSTFLGMHSTALSAGMRVQMRFYKPSYQDDLVFPEDAEGYRFQTARFFRDINGSLGGSASLPVLGAVTANVGLQVHRGSSTYLREIFGGNTLTGPLLRYMRLRSFPDADACWQAFCIEQENSLVDLMKGLGNPQSEVAKEALYWSELLPDSGGKHAIFKKAMETFRADGAQVSTAIESLSAFFNELQEPFNAMKRRSRWLVPEPLV